MGRTRSGGYYAQPTYTMGADATARAALVDRLDAIAAALADGDISVARIAGLDQLLGTGALRAGTLGAATTYPTSGGMVTVAAGVGAWAWGGWTPIVAAGVIGIAAVVSVTEFIGVDSDTFIWELGQGDIGSEAGGLATGGTRVQDRSDVGLPRSHTVHVVPPAQAAANARLVMRLKSSGGGNTMTFLVTPRLRPF